MSKTVLFVFNLHSGKGFIKNKIFSILDELSKLDYTTITFSTQQGGDARRLINKHADELDFVLAAGGDGTVSDAAAGIIESGRDIPLVFIPCGSTNDYGCTLNAPTDPVETVTRIADDSFRYIDIGRFNEKYFTYIAAFGFLTDISYTTDQNLKNVLGYGAYLIEVTKRLFNIPVIKATITTEEGVCITDGWFLGLISNSKQVAGIRDITGGDVLLDDGLFEVTLMRATSNPIEFLEAVTSLKSTENSRFVERFKSRKITIEFEEDIAWTVDGEPGGEYKNVVIENLYHAVRISVSKNNENEIFGEVDENSDSAEISGDAIVLDSGTAGEIAEGGEIVESAEIAGGGEIVESGEIAGGGEIVESTEIAGSEKSDSGDK